MEQDSRLRRFEILVATACIGAHANSHFDGFRQRDLKFLIALFSNWLVHGISTLAFDVRNTQISRYLSRLIREGYARQITRKGPPFYRLTRIGLVELLGRVVNPQERPGREYFLFVYYFTKSYRTLLESLVKDEGQEFPYALKLELDNLLDTEKLLSREIEAVENELKKLTYRIVDAKKMNEYVKQACKKKTPIESIILEVQSRYPYQLIHQKPMVELLHGIPPERREWELSTGSLNRMNYIWKPTEALLQSYLQQLKLLM